MILPIFTEEEAEYAKLFDIAGNNAIFCSALRPTLSHLLSTAPTTRQPAAVVQFDLTRVGIAIQNPLAHHGLRGLVFGAQG
jgi:hypothetical protein